MPISNTQRVVEHLYAMRAGQMARVIRGRKIKPGTIVRLETGPVESRFKRNEFNVRTSEGWTDANNLEVIPDGAEVSCTGEMLCGRCQKCFPATEFVYSGWDGYGRPRYPKHGYTAGYAFHADGAECRSCAAESLSGLERGTDGHVLALAVLAGDLSAVCPLIDEVIADGDEYRANELKRQHKLDKPARKRKADAEPVAG